MTPEIYDESTLLSRYELVGGAPEMIPYLKQVSAACKADPELAAMAIKWSEDLYEKTPVPDAKVLRTWKTPEDKLGDAVGAFNMMIALSVAPLIRETHKKFGFAESKLAEVFSWYRAIIDIYARRHNGVPGVDHTRLFWFRNHVDGLLFRFGAMEFLRGPAPEYLPAEFKATLKDGDEIGTFHYPGGPGGLDTSRLKAAYSEAMVFWKQTFGHYPRAWASESWLFNPIWKELIPNSKVAHSTDMYEFLGTLPYNPEEPSGLYYVYLADGIDPRDYPVTNSLERAFCTVFDRGEKLIEGCAFVRCDENGKLLFQDE